MLLLTKLTSECVNLNLITVTTWRLILAGFWCSALQEVRIPPGPRLLILNHVDRYRTALKPPVPPPRPLQPPQVAHQRK